MQNNTPVCGNTRFISSIGHDINELVSNIMFNTRNKSGISEHPYIFLFRDWS